MSGIKIEPASERSYLAAFPADFPQHARLRERSLAGKEAIVEGADALGDQPVEAAYLPDRLCLYGHSLTLVR